MLLLGATSEMFKARTNKKPGPGYKTRAMITFNGMAGRTVRRYYEEKAKKAESNLSTQMYIALRARMDAERTAPEPTTPTEYPREGVE